MGWVSGTAVGAWGGLATPQSPTAFLTSAARRRLTRTAFPSRRVKVAEPSPLGTIPSTASRFTSADRWTRRNRPAVRFARSHDGGETFATPSIIPGSLDPDQSFNGSLQGLLMQKLAANTRGDIAVVNSTFKPGQRSQLWLILGHVQDD